jgi:hypothetical protein
MLRTGENPMHHRNHSLAAAALISILVCIGGCSSTPQDDTSRRPMKVT